MANHQLRRALLTIAILSILSLLLTQCTTTVKFTKANDSTQDPTAGFVGIYRYFNSTHPDFTGAAEPKNTPGLIYGSVPWRPNPASPSWGLDNNLMWLWQPDWYSTPSNKTKIDAAVMNTLTSTTGVSGMGLQFNVTPGVPGSPYWLNIWAASLGRFTVEWEARINMTQAASLNFTMNSHDDSWFFFDGTLEIDLGGGRTVSTGAGAWASPILQAGSMHTITIYYADRSGLGGGPAEFYFGAVPSVANAFVYTDPSNLLAKKSFEDSLKHQALAIESSENQLGSLPAANRTSGLFEGIENLTEEQESNLTSFQDMIENDTPQWIPINKTLVLNESRLLPAEFISLLESFETLLHVEYDIKTKFMDMLNESQPYLPDFSTFVNSTENLLTSDDELLASFENLTLNLFPSTTLPYIPSNVYTLDQQTYFLESYEHLLQNQSQLLNKFQKLILDDPVTSTQISVAIWNGLRYLASVQNTGPSPPAGSWSINGRYPEAKTALVLLKFETDAWSMGLDPFDNNPLSSTYYQYANNVIAGMNYLLSCAQVVTPLAKQRHGSNLDDPDSSHDGQGIAWILMGPYGEPCDVYTTGLALSAISESGHPNRHYVIGAASTYEQIAQDTADWLAYAQSDYGPGEGGWSYLALDNSGNGNSGYYEDNSNTGYAVLGLAYAISFGCIVPQWVKNELNIWIGNIQGPDGGSYYRPLAYSNTYPWSAPWENIYKTGDLILEMGFCGDTSSTTRMKDAENYLAANWLAPNSDPGWGDGLAVAEYLAMFATMKGLAYIRINNIMPGNINWYNDFASAIVAQQGTGNARKAGAWPTCIWDDGEGDGGDGILSTAWALLTLEKAAPPLVYPFIESFEDLLTRQSERITSFENLLGLLPAANRTGELYESLENLTEEQEGLLQSFEGTINSTSLTQPEFINLLNSTEDLLHRQYAIEGTFMDMLNSSFPYFNYYELEFSVMGLLRSDTQLLKGMWSFWSRLVHLNVPPSIALYFEISCGRLGVNQGQLEKKDAALFPRLIMPPPNVTGISYSPTSGVVDIGQSILFNATVPSGPYAYQWYFNGAPVAGATNATFTLTATFCGNCTVYLWITCNASAISSDIYIVTVNAQLAASIIPVNITTSSRQSRTFTSTVTGGTLPIAYQWYLNGVAVPGATGSTWTFSPRSAGFYKVYVEVTDSIGQQAESNDANTLYVPGRAGAGGHCVGAYLR
jgi:fibro-slime domain-containing protein